MATCREPLASSVRIWFPEYHSGLQIRMLGMFGAGLAACMVVLGLMVATDSLRGALLPPGSGIDAQSFYSTPFFATVTFCVLVSWPSARANGPAHKRLMLIATVAILGAAVARWPFEIVHGPFVGVVLALYVLLLVGFDLLSRKRIHSATLRGGLFMIVVQQLAFPIGQTLVWRHFATAALKVWVRFHF